MAVSLYEDSEQSPGEKIFLRYDPDTAEPSYAFVRRLGPEKLKQIQRQFERAVKRRGRPRTWAVPKKNTEAFGHACLDWAFLDLENYVIRIADDGAREFFTAELAEEFIVGSEITLDGRLTKNIKSFLTDRDTEVSLKISRAAGLGAEDDEDDADDIARGREEYLEGNSQTGSTSDLNTPKRTATSATSQTPAGPVRSAELQNKS